MSIYQYRISERKKRWMDFVFIFKEEIQSLSSNEEIKIFIEKIARHWLDYPEAVHWTNIWEHVQTSYKKLPTDYKIVLKLRAQHE